MTLEQEVVELRAQVEILRDLNAQLRGQVAALRQQLAEAEERVAELEAKSRSFAGLGKANRRKPEGPKAPRQPRAKEQNRARKRCEVVTRSEEHRVEQCPDCGQKLRKQRVAWRREVVELPPPSAVEVTEHVVFKGYCPHCAGWKYAPLAAKGIVVGQRRFGVRLMALVGYLSASLRLPCREIQHYLRTVHQLSLSVGAVVDLLRGVAEEGQAAVAEIKAQVRQSAIVHADETGWREDGQNGYIWVFSTPGEQGVRYYLYRHSRGQQVVEDVLGEEFRGVLASDYCSAYNVYRGRHQRCWSHLSRDLHDLKEEHAEEPEGLAWAEAVQALYDEGQAFVQGQPCQAEREKRYVSLVERAVALGLRYAQSEHPCRALAKRLLRHQDELFQFVLVADLRADNNLAERSLRLLVVIRKISGGSRSPTGSQTRMDLATLFGTWKAQALDPLPECRKLLGANS
jgi:transposase